MRKKTSLLIIIIILLLITLAGCQAADTTTTPTDGETSQTTDDITGEVILDCPNRAAFGYIEEDVPLEGAYFSTPGLFRWSYYAAGDTAPDWNQICVPTYYTLYLSPGPDFTTVTSYPVTPSNVVNMGGRLEYSLILEEELDPICYRWMVVGQYNGINIDDDQLPLLHDETAWEVVNGSSLMNSWYRTGPCCEPQAVCSFEEETEKPVADATNTSQPAATNTSPPAATNTSPPAATNTSPPTATNTTAPPTPTNTPVPMGTVKVHVWKDVSWYGNQQATEFNYPGVVVYLRRGSCPFNISKPRQDTTDSSGSVFFNNVTYGTYCVSIGISHCSEEGWFYLPPEHPAEIYVGSTPIVYVEIGVRYCD